MNPENCILFKDKLDILRKYESFLAFLLIDMF